MRTRLALALGLTAVLAPLAPSEAMQLDVSRAELCRISDAVVVGDVVDVETVWAPGEAGGIEHHVRIAVEQVLVGAKSRTVDLVLPGGKLGDLRHWVEDVPELEDGERYLLFLHAKGTTFQVIGGDGGAVRVATPSHPLGESMEAHERDLEGCHAR
jgi:hypothetical protein